MTPTNFEINVALLMIAVAFVLIMMFRKSEAAHSTRRMMSMMRRFSLDPGLIRYGDRKIKETLKVARQRCEQCRAEGFCERWLAGKASGKNDFCPNGGTFQSLR
ncbi:MAG: DUF6455 family protein [Proteobacteria bacterium]|nr:DUF6455 family protein [Pseudomonadota bacterium]MDA1022962.1 DUF6455 family protein [Pseudomonadota bacterium]